jgi:hypothetical protein
VLWLVATPDQHHRRTLDELEGDITASDAHYGELDVDTNVSVESGQAVPVLSGKDDLPSSQELRQHRDFQLSYLCPLLLRERQELEQLMGRQVHPSWRIACPDP